MGRYQRSVEDQHEGKRRFGAGDCAQQPGLVVARGPRLLHVARVEHGILSSYGCARVAFRQT